MEQPLISLEYLPLIIIFELTKNVDRVKSDSLYK